MAEWISEVGTVPAVIWLVGAALTCAGGIWIYVLDYKKMQVMLWKILAVVGMGFLTAFVARLTSGNQMYWPLFLFVPIYIVLNLLNSCFNKKDSLIGQGDLDLFSGTISLFLCMAIVIMGNMNVTEIIDGYDMRAIDSMSLLMNTLTWFLLGLIIAIVCGCVRSTLLYVRAKKRGEDVGKFSFYFNVIKAKIPIMIAYLPCFLYSMYAYTFII